MKSAVALTILGLGLWFQSSEAQNASACVRVTGFDTFHRNYVDSERYWTFVDWKNSVTRSGHVGGVEFNVGRIANVTIALYRRIGPIRTNGRVRLRCIATLLYTPTSLGVNQVSLPGSFNAEIGDMLGIYWANFGVIKYSSAGGGNYYELRTRARIGRRATFRHNRANAMRAFSFGKWDLGCDNPGNRMTISCDNKLEALYINEEHVHAPLFTLQAYANNHWLVPSYYDVPDEPYHVAFYGIDRGDIAGCIASDEKDLVTNNKWRCSHFYEDDWWRIDFDDSHWPRATPHDYDSYGSHSWERIPEIREPAQFIWSNNYLFSEHPNIYCRLDPDDFVHPYCYCQGHADPLFIQFDSMTLAAVLQKTYLFARSTADTCLYESYVTVQPPPEIAAAYGVLMIGETNVIVGGSKFTFTYDLAFYVDDVEITTNTWSSGPVSMIKFNNGKSLNLTLSCDVTFSWYREMRDFLKPPTIDLRYQSSTHTAEDKAGGVGGSGKVLIDRQNRFTAYSEIRNVSFFAKTDAPFAVGIVRDLGNGSMEVTHKVNITGAIAEQVNQFDIEAHHMRAELGDYFAIFSPVGVGFPYDPTGPSETYWYSSDDWKAGKGDLVNFGTTDERRDYGFDFDFVVEGYRTMISSTKLILITPRKDGDKLSGVCGNCDGVNNDMHFYPDGTEIDATGTELMETYLKSWETQVPETPGAGSNLQSGVQFGGSLSGGGD